MSKQKETTEERLARMKKEQEAAKAGKDTELVKQLTHESTGEPDFNEITKKLKARKEKEAKSKNDGYTKTTIYVRTDVLEAFDALQTRHGQRKEMLNEALMDYIQKKTRELEK